MPNAIRVLPGRAWQLSVGSLRLSKAINLAQQILDGKLEDLPDMGEACTNCAEEGEEQELRKVVCSECIQKDCSAKLQWPLVPLRQRTL